MLADGAKPQGASLDTLRRHLGSFIAVRDKLAPIRDTLDRLDRL